MKLNNTTGPGPENSLDTPNRRGLEELESIVEKGVDTFVEVGLALKEICSRRLYKDRGYLTFEAYLEGRWKISRILRLSADSGGSSRGCVANWRHSPERTPGSEAGRGETNETGASLPSSRVKASRQGCGIC